MVGTGDVMQQEQAGDRQGRNPGDPHPPVMLYDGLCGFCDRTVRLVLRFDRRRTMRFAALQGDFAQNTLQRHAQLRGVDSLIVVENAGTGQERVHVRSEAVLFIARYLGGAWKAATLMRILPRGLRDGAYDLFARHRYRIFGRFDTCPLPAPDVRARFLD